MSDSLLFIDVETGGLAPGYNPLLEIGARYEAHDTEFSVMIRQDKASWMRCEPQALKVNQFTFELLEQQGVPLSVAGSLFAGWLTEHDIRSDTVTWVGQNPNFDIEFLSKNIGDYLKFVGLLPIRNVINVMDLARTYRQLDRKFKPLTLSGVSISKALGLDPEDAVHRAMGGVNAVRQNYYELTRRLSLYQSVKE